ncbi:hypothetical protein ABPG72_004619 [Tetrahymena utriculariae]
MTTYYWNTCIPAFRYDYTVVPRINVESYRKGMVAEIFLIYLIYLAIIVIGTLKNKYRESGSYAEGKQLASNQDAQKAEILPLVEKLNYYEFDRFFYPYYGFHSISVGMALLYAPYAWEISIIWIHFLFYVIMIALKIKFGEEKNKILYGIYAFLQFINFSLIISSLIALGNNKGCTSVY